MSYTRGTQQTLCGLLEVLDSLEAVFRMQPERQLRPNATHLEGSGHLNLVTRLGPLDLLAEIGEGMSYDELLVHTQWILISDGHRIRVLSLDQIIAIKERLGGEKDLAGLPVLRATAREAKRRE